VIHHQAEFTRKQNHMSDKKPVDQAKFSRREVTQMLGAGLLGSSIPALAQSDEKADRHITPAAARPAESLLSSPVTEISRALRDRSVSSYELVTAYLQRIEDINPAINAVIQLNAERAIDAARQADSALSRGEITGPLHGIPMTLKDSIDTAGVITTYGTLGRRDFTPKRDATVAARLKAAGAILLGKTNTPEFTLSFDTDNLVYGRTRNPFDPGRTPGGSSGGSAAAVTASMCAFDIGSDTGGSIRVPSHFCGTAGLKPTQGRVPRTGHAVSFGGIHDPLTQLGPITRSVQDLELILRVIAGPDGHDPFITQAAMHDFSIIAMAGLRVGWHADNGLFTPSAEIQEVVTACANALQQAGARTHEIIPTPIPATTAELHELFVWADDGGAWIQRLLDAAGTTQAHPAIAKQINKESMLEGSEITRRIESRDRFRSDMLAFMQDYDVMLTPVAGFTAPLYEETEDEAHFPGYTYTQVYNLCGLPVVVVRCGTSSDGLPIGVQIAAQPWREDMALAVARHVEKVFGGWIPPGMPGTQVSLESTA
jgi:amidase